MCAIRIFDDRLDQAPTDASPLLAAIDHHETDGAEARAVLPPQRGSDRRALVIGYGPAATELMMKLPILQRCDQLSACVRSKRVRESAVSNRRIMRSTGR